VREIAELGSEKDRTKLANMLFQEYNEMNKPDLKKVKRTLTSWLYQVHVDNR
jgi:hypothetical protein